MASYAIHPPIHLTAHRDEPIRTVEAAATFLERHIEDNAEEARDPETALLLAELRGASRPAAAEAAGVAFRSWAAAHGLLVEPEEAQAAPGMDETGTKVASP